MSINLPNGGIDPYGTSVLGSATWIAWLNDPTALRNVLVEATASVNGIDKTFYLSVLQFASTSTDVPANQPYRAVLVREDIQTTEQMTIDGSATMAIGEVGIANADGAFDSWLTYVWTNRKIRILLGDVRWPASSYQVVFTGVTADIGSKSRDTVNLKIRDNLERLNVAITEHLLGGTTTNQGATVPLAFGEIVNLSPLLIDPPGLQYQVHDGSINGLIEVRDNGVPIANDLIGWSAVTANLALGTFKLNSAPVGAITVSLQGDTGGGSYVSTVADIIKRIVMGYGYAGNRFVAADIDTTNFGTFNSAHPQVVGMPVSGSTNTVSVIQQIASSLLAQLTTSRAGLLQLKQLDFTNLTPTLDIKPAHMVEHTITLVDRPPVQGSVWLSFCQNQTPQANLQTSLPAEALALMQKPYLESTAVDLSTKTLYKLTAEPTMETTLLVKRTDADAEALRRLNNRKVPRAVYQFDGYAMLMQLTLGQAVRLFHGRFNLTTGPTGIVVSMTTSWAMGRATVGVMV